jgi:hypothetical protein
LLSRALGGAAAIGQVDGGAVAVESRRVVMRPGVADALRRAALRDLDAGRAQARRQRINHRRPARAAAPCSTV